MGRVTWLSSAFSLFRSTVSVLPVSHMMIMQCPCSATLWAAGDMLSQRMQRMPMHRAGARQTALTAAFGGFVFGPMGFAWYQWLDSVTNALFGAGGGVKAILAKVGYLIG